MPFTAKEVEDAFKKALDWWGYTVTNVAEKTRCSVKKIKESNEKKRFEIGGHPEE